ncbi:MAG: TetR/AcrR family transcriptional regulator [Thermomicrobiales bacterium]
MSATDETTTEAEPTTRRPGRPRSAQAERAILQAALELFADFGYEGMSIEGVAARAGVGKTTIYRRWASKDELLIAALGHVQSEVPVLDSGDLRTDLVAMATNALEFFTAGGVNFGAILVRAMGEARTNPSVFAALSETVLIPRMSLFATRIQGAIDHGELRSDIDLRLFIEILAGPIFFHTLITDRFIPNTPDYAERLIDTLLQGLAPR